MNTSSTVPSSKENKTSSSLAVRTSSPAAGATYKSTPTGDINKKQEDPMVLRLRRSWRSLASSLVVAARVASKPNKDSQAIETSLVTMLRARTELRRVLTSLESKKQGNEQEMEALECMVRTQPTALSKKRRNPAENPLEPPPKIQAP
eukprot:scaffold6581_cov57-Attheya_sp.AAC.1